MSTILKALRDEITRRTGELDALRLALNALSKNGTAPKEAEEPPADHTVTPRTRRKMSRALRLSYNDSKTAQMLRAMYDLTREGTEPIHYTDLGEVLSASHPGDFSYKDVGTRLSQIAREHRPPRTTRTGPGRYMLTKAGRNYVEKIKAG